MARRTKKKSKNYPNIVAFDENLEGVAAIFDTARFNVPEIEVAIKGADDHLLASALEERVLFFTCDSDWLTRQPPYKHGGIVFLDCGNLSALKKGGIIYNFLYVFHIKNKLLDTIKNKRFRLTMNSLWEETVEGEKRQIW